MKSLTQNVFRLSDIRHSWLLYLSMLLFVLSLYNNRIHPDITGTVEWLTYGIAIGSAFIWSILNYVDHIRLDALYRKSDSIDGYVGSLAMDKQEKEDLRVYLNDFVKDLELNGKTREDAVKTAIAQFQAQEFTMLTDYKEILELPIHYYLLGYSLICIAAAIVLQGLIHMFFHDSFTLKAISFMLILYTISFVGLLFLYRLADKLIMKKK